MFRQTVLCLAAMLVVNGIVWADDKDDLKSMGGTWNIQKAVFMGKESTELFKAVVLKIEGDKYTVTSGGGTDKGTLTIDSAKKPKRMTIKSTEGVSKDKAFQCIYELKDDTLTVCYSFEGKDPPKEFESKEGTMTLLATYKRDKK